MTGSTTRRGLLLGAAGALALAGCGNDDRGSAPTSASSPGAGVTRVRYGSDPSQYADLRKPAGTPRATVITIHGGGYLSRISADGMNPFVTALTDLGYATWNVEYRRLGTGGGYPQTFTDVAQAIDRLQGTPYADDAIVLGHSAGAQLAVWAASRTASTPGGASRVRLRSAISLAGPLELSARTFAAPVSQVVDQLMGGTPQEVPERWDLVDPSRLVPASCPVWVAQVANDTLIPADQGPTYATLARRAGGKVTFVGGLPGNHGQLVNPTGPAYLRVLKIVEQATA